MSTICKQFSGQIKANENDRSVTMVISTNDVDRDGDIIEPSGIDLRNFKKNPVVLFAHNYREPPIAKAIDIRVEGNKLVSTTQFPEPGVYGLSDTIFNLLKGGFINAASIGFEVLESSPLPEGKGFHFTKTELLEWSFVPVPANPNALVQARSKNIDLDPLKDWAQKCLSDIDEEPVTADDIRRATIKALSEAFAQFESNDEPDIGGVTEKEIIELTREETLNAINKYTGRLD